MANKPIGIDSEIKKAIKETIKSGKEQIYPIKNCKGLELRQNLRTIQRKHDMLKEKQEQPN